MHQHCSPKLILNSVFPFSPLTVHVWYIGLSRPAESIQCSHLVRRWTPERRRGLPFRRRFQTGDHPSSNSAHTFPNYAVFTFRKVQPMSNCASRNSVCIRSTVCVHTRESGGNANSNTVEPDRPQHDRVWKWLCQFYRARTKQHRCFGTFHLVKHLKTATVSDSF